MNKNIIEIKNATVGYNNIPVLRDINFEVTTDDFIVITGPNGGGKTTLLNLLLGLLNPIKGTINRDKKAIIGYQSQYQKLDKQFPISVEDIVLMGILPRSKNPTKRNPDHLYKLNKALKLMEICDLRKKHINELSGGQFQRVLFARAIASHPDLLILDEPDTYLDHDHKKQLHRVLQHYNEKHAVIIVTHNSIPLIPFSSKVYYVDEKIELQKKE